MHMPSFPKSSLNTLIASLSLTGVGLVASASAVAQTVIPAISSGMSPARGSSITNVVIPAATQSTGGNTNATATGSAPAGSSNALQSGSIGSDPGDTSGTSDTALPNGKTDAKTGKAVMAYRFDATRTYSA